MKAALASALSILICISGLLAQTDTSYRDVGVIVNTNSEASVEIANYFMAKRKIPAKNLIPVNVSSAEEISESEFNELLTQIENYLLENELDLALNYLVTTKGCPLKVLRNSQDSLNCNSSVESELMLLTAENKVHIGTCISMADLSSGSFVGNPYFNATTNFNREEFGSYLVTRLDGYDVQTVKSLIDRSGPYTYVNKDSVQFVFDRAPNFSGNPLDDAFTSTTTLLRLRGWKVDLNNDSVYLTGKQNVLGYASWGSNDSYADSFTEHGRTYFSWANGSIAETHVSTSARSFTPGTSYGQSLIADLISEGVCGAKGYVYEPYVIAIAYSNILFNRYTTSTTQGFPAYNLAESYFSASRMIGWMDVVIGDPKTSITTNQDIASGPGNISSPAFYVFPNPADSFFRIRSAGNNHTTRFALCDLSGRKILSGTFISETWFSVADINPGIYLLNLETEGVLTSRKVAVIR